MLVTNLFEIYPPENDVIYLKVIDGKDFTAEKMAEAYQILEKIANGKPYKLMFDVRDVTISHISSEAFKVSSSKQYAPNQIAEAFLFNSLHVRILINFYFKVFKPVVPSKMFQCPTEAEKWLKEIQANSYASAK